MKILIALSMLLTLSLAQAQSVESFFTPSENLTTDRPDRPRPPRPPSQNSTRLFMQNNCYTDVYVVIRHMNIRNEMESKGFWRIFPGQIVYLNEIKGREYLLHAFTSDSRYFWKGPYTIPFEGRNYPAMMVQLSPDRGGDWTSVLYCH
jgi:hypothetical protein